MKKQLKMLFRIGCVNGEDDIQEQGMAEDFVSGLWRIIRNLMEAMEMVLRCVCRQQDGYIRIWNRPGQQQGQQQR